MEKFEDPGRLRVDLNLLRTVERKLESKRRKSRAPECLDLFRISSRNSNQNAQNSKKNAQKNAKKRLGMSRFVSGVETNRDIPRRFFCQCFFLYLLVYLKSETKKRSETRDIPRRSGVLDFRRFDSSFRSKFETDRDIPRHSGALDFRRFDSSFRSTVRSGLRSTLRCPESSYFRKKHRAFFFSSLTIWAAPPPAGSSAAQPHRTSPLLPAQQTLSWRACEPCVAARRQFRGRGRAAPAPRRTGKPPSRSWRQRRLCTSRPSTQHTPPARDQSTTATPPKPWPLRRHVPGGGLPSAV